MQLDRLAALWNRTVLHLFPQPLRINGLQAVSLLVQAAASVFAVPLAIRIHEGVVWSNRDRRTVLDKMLPDIVRCRRQPA